MSEEEELYKSMYALDQPCKLQRPEAVGVLIVYRMPTSLLWAAWGATTLQSFAYKVHASTPRRSSVMPSSSNPPEVIGIAKIVMLQHLHTLLCSYIPPCSRYSTTYPGDKTAFIQESDQQLRHLALSAIRNTRAHAQGRSMSLFSSK
jgi:hypothetical protein